MSVPSIAREGEKPFILSSAEVHIVQGSVVRCLNKVILPATVVITAQELPSESIAIEVPVVFSPVPKVPLELKVVALFLLPIYTVRLVLFSSIEICGTLFWSICISTLAPLLVATTSKVLPSHIPSVRLAYLK